MTNDNLTKMSCFCRYVVITPARNEASFLAQTIESVIVQKIVPLRWVIVSDGSTDGTDEIVKKYMQAHPWIELLRMPERKERHFAGKVYAFKAGYERVQGLDYDFIVSLDADITFDAEYFEFIFSKFAYDPALGLAGTPFREGESQYDYRFSRKEHVSGACQVFRRKCFEDIGGYVPLKAGAIDLTAVVTARMKGWKTETFTEKVCFHHRKMGSAKHNIIFATLKSGFYDYPMGVHPLWQLFRSIYQVSRKPYFLGGLLFIGYIWAMITRARVPVSKEFIQFRRKEQIGWLKDHVRKIVRLKK